MPQDDSPSAPRVGSRLAQFRLLREIGRGGMGRVYEAEDTLLHRPVAVKVLRFDADDAEGRRVLREARAVARLDHPQVVRIHHIGKWADGFYLVLELMPGGSLEQRIAGGRPLDWAAAGRAVAEAARGLGHAHEAGLIHRDVKPANLLTDGRGRVKVGDFGLVRAVEGGAAAVSHGGYAALSHGTSGRSVVAGTPKYMSPEQCRGEAADERSDLYSLGITLYALLTGRPPFDAATPTQLMFAHCTKPMPDPRGLVPDLPAACAEVVRRATAKQPADRFQTADEFLAALPPVPDLPASGVTPVSTTVRAAPPVRAAQITPPVDDDEEEVEEDPTPIRRRRPTPNRRQWVTAAVVGGITIPAVAVGIAAWRSWDGGPGNAGRGAGGPPVRGAGDVAGQGPPGPPGPAPAIAAAGEFAFGSSVASVSISDDGTLLAAGGESGGVLLWEVGTGKLFKELKWGDVRSVAFTHYERMGGTTLIGGGAKGRLWWTRANGVDGPFIEGLVPDDTGTVSAVARQGREQVAFGYCAGTFSGVTLCYSVPERKEACQIGRRGMAPLRRLRYAPGPDATLAAVTFNSGLTLWDSTSGNRLDESGRPEIAQGVSDAVFHPTARTLAVAIADRVRFWDRAATKFGGETQPLAAGRIAAVDYSPDGKTLAVGDSTGTVSLYENGGPAPARTLTAGKTGVRAVAFRAGVGRLLACGCADGIVRVWDLGKPA